MKIYSLKKATEQSLLAFYNNVICEKEFLLLYDINGSHNFSYIQRNYNLLDLQNFTEAECDADVQFRKNYIIPLKYAIWFPDVINCYNYDDTKTDGTETFCFLLNRLSYLTQFSNLTPRFAGPLPQISIVLNQTLDLVRENWRHLLDTLVQPLLSSRNLSAFTYVILEKRSCTRLYQGIYWWLLVGFFSTQSVLKNNL